MFGFYSNRLGCLGSIFVSILGTILIVALIRGCWASRGGWGKGVLAVPQWSPAAGPFMALRLRAAEFDAVTTHPGKNRQHDSGNRDPGVAGVGRRVRLRILLQRLGRLGAARRSESQPRQLGVCFSLLRSDVAGLRGDCDRRCSKFGSRYVGKRKVALRNLGVACVTITARYYSVRTWTNRSGAQ